MYYAIHLDAGHDTNGNPRRALLVYDRTGDLIGSVDQGYLTARQAVGDVTSEPVTILAQVPTNAAFYREAIKP